MEQESRFLVRGRPPGFAVDALPKHFEVLVQQDDGLWTAAARTRNVMLIEDIIDRNASSHIRIVGRRDGDVSFGPAFTELHRERRIARDCVMLQLYSQPAPADDDDERRSAQFARDVRRCQAMKSAG